MIFYMRILDVFGLIINEALVYPDQPLLEHSLGFR